MKRQRVSQDEISPTLLHYLSKGTEGFVENRFQLFEYVCAIGAAAENLEALQTAYLLNLTSEERTDWEVREPVQP